MFWCFGFLVRVAPAPLRVLMVSICLPRFAKLVGVCVRVPLSLRMYHRLSPPARAAKARKPPASPKISEISLDEEKLLRWHACTSYAHERPLAT